MCLLIFDIGFLEGQLSNQGAGDNKINFVALILPYKEIILYDVFSLQLSKATATYLRMYVHRINMYVWTGQASLCSWKHSQWSAVLNHTSALVNLHDVSLQLLNCKISDTNISAGIHDFLSDIN